MIEALWRLAFKHLLNKRLWVKLKCTFGSHKRWRGKSKFTFKKELLD